MADLTWDVTVICSTADSYIDLAIQGPGSVIAMETVGPINESARAFLNDLGRRISVLSGDNREHLFLFQRISVAIQCFNAVLRCCTTVFPLRTTRTSFSTSNLFVLLLIFPILVLRGY